MSRDGGLNSGPNGPVVPENRSGSARRVRFVAPRIRLSCQSLNVPGCAQTPRYQSEKLLHSGCGLADAMELRRKCDAQCR